MLAELLMRVGEPYDEERHLADFGLESADYVADFYNNGGLEFHNNGVNYALQYASATEGRVEIGAWAWFDGEDFDTDATFETYEEDDFSAGELKRIADRIEDIYEHIAEMEREAFEWSMDEDQTGIPYPF